MCRFALLVVVIAVHVGCGTLIDDQIALLVEGETVDYSTERIAHLLDIAAKRWPFEGAMHEPSVVVVDETLFAMGLTASPDEVLIRPTLADGTPLYLAGSALVHECAHATWWLAGDADSDHLHHEWNEVERWNDDVAIEFSAWDTQ